MKEFFKKACILLLVVFIGTIFHSVSRCDAAVVGANAVKVMYACEENIMHLSCPHRSLSVKIMSAKYGRLLSKTNICAPTSDSQVIRDCGENNVKPNVQKLCVGKTECSFEVDNSNLGAFCVNVYKYLSVVFQCVLRPTTKEPPTTTPLPSTSPPTLNLTGEHSTSLSTSNFTNNSTHNASEPTMSITSEAMTQDTFTVSKMKPKASKPDNELYDRDVFSRKSGTRSILSSGHHSTSMLLVSLLVYVVFDGQVFRVT